MISPHIKVTNDPDGVRLELKGVWLVLPPPMARELAATLVECAGGVELDALYGKNPLPAVTPTGDPIK